MIFGHRSMMELYAKEDLIAPEQAFGIDVIEDKHREELLYPAFGQQKWHDK
jgi:hypothetical protein